MQPFATLGPTAQLREQSLSFLCKHLLRVGRVPDSVLEAGGRARAPSPRSRGPVGETGMQTRD